MALLCEYSFDTMGTIGTSAAVSSTITDTSGNGNTLTVLNSAMDIISGHTNAGVNGDGNTCAQLSSTSAIKPTTAVTWMCWARVTGNTYGWGQIFGRCNDDTAWGDAFSFYMSADNNTTYRFTCPIQTTSEFRNHTDATMVLTLDTWVHIAATWSASDGTLRVFKNGSEISNVPHGGGTALYYGSGGNTTRYFNILLNEQYNEHGNQIQIDDVRVFDAQLDAATITTWMNTPAGGTTPVLTTNPVTNVTPTTAQGNGFIVSDGYQTITERGFCWSTSANPTTSDSKVTAAGTTGAYSASLTGLSSNTLYHVRAYATNSIGTAYGSDVTFRLTSTSVAWFKA